VMNAYAYISTNLHFAQGGVLSEGTSLSRWYPIPYHPALSLILFYIDYSHQSYIIPAIRRRVILFSSLNLLIEVET
jgi:hypothetical protein